MVEIIPTPAKPLTAAEVAAADAKGKMDALKAAATMAADSAAMTADKAKAIPFPGSPDGSPMQVGSAAQFAAADKAAAEFDKAKVAAVDQSKNVGAPIPNGSFGSLSEAAGGPAPMEQSKNAPMTNPFAGSVGRTPPGMSVENRVSLLEARLAYLTRINGWPTEEHDEVLAARHRAEQRDFRGHPTHAAGAASEPGR